MTLKTKIIIVIIMAFTSWTTVSAQYETDVPPDMMNMEYAEKADSMGKAILVNKGSYATAIELFKRSSTIYKHFNGETDESYLTAMALLAKCYMRNDQIQDAISVTCILCGIYEKNGLDREQYAVIKDNLSVYYAIADEGEKDNAHPFLPDDQRISRWSSPPHARNHRPQNPVFLLPSHPQIK